MLGRFAYNLGLTVESIQVKCCNRQAGKHIMCSAAKRPCRSNSTRVASGLSRTSSVGARTVTRAFELLRAFVAPLMSDSALNRVSFCASMVSIGEAWTCEFVKQCRA